jgi:hypothetical protein
MMEQYLGRMRQDISCKTGLLNLATVIASEKGIMIDRSAKRSKECLICWFCENAKEIMDISKLKQWLKACNLRELPEQESGGDEEEGCAGLDNGEVCSWIASDFWNSITLDDQFWGEENE